MQLGGISNFRRPEQGEDFQKRPEQGVDFQKKKTRTEKGFSKKDQNREMIFNKNIRTGRGFSIKKTKNIAKRVFRLCFMY